MDVEQVGSKENNTLYMICADFGCYDAAYTIHALDISRATSDFQGRIPLPDPIFSLPSEEFQCEMGFGVLDSKLYVLGGAPSFVNDADGYCKEEPSLKVHIFDTSRFGALPVSTDYRTYVKEGPLLKAQKRKPVVIPLRGKLYVIAKSLSPTATDLPLVEVLDPKVTNEWIPIPVPLKFSQLPEPRTPGCTYYNILTYATSGSQIILSLLLSQSYGGVYILETDTYTWSLVDVTPNIIPYLPSTVIGHPTEWLSLGYCWCSTFTPMGWMVFMPKESFVLSGLAIRRTDRIELSRIMLVDDGPEFVSLSWCVERRTRTIHFMVDFLHMSFLRRQKDPRGPNVLVGRSRWMSFEKTELDEEGVGLICYCFIE